MNQLKNIIVSVGIALSSGGLLHAITLANYNFNDQTSVTATLTATNDGSSLFTNSLFSVSDGSFTSTSFNSPLPPDAGFAVADSGSWNAATPTKFFSFTITPTEGSSITITSISFDYRQTAAGALNYQIDVGSSINAASGIFTRDIGWVSTGSITLTGLSSITTATEIRIYGFNGGTGSFAIDQVTLTGTAVPEPSATAALAGLATLGLVASRRRRPAV